MGTHARLTALALALTVTSTLGVTLLAHAEPTPTKVVGIRPGHHDTKYGHEFYFEIPTRLAVHLSPGDLLEPDDGLSQRVMYFGGSIGFCIDPNATSGDITTAYRVRGRTSERALAAARAAVTADAPRDTAIWAAMRAAPEPRRVNRSRR